ncbi:hypothetical protein TNCV_3616041 [Trichonephila clavipes]|nr:hypothetical protein TNCV_3616041 [Trichonephila clavipes]
MSRSGGQFEARPPVFKSPRKLGTHLSTHCMVSEADCYAVGHGLKPRRRHEYVCKRVVPLRNGGTLNSRRAASPLIEVGGREREEVKCYFRLYSSKNSEFWTICQLDTCDDRSPRTGLGLPLYTMITRSVKRRQTVKLVGPIFVYGPRSYFFLGALGLKKSSDVPDNRRGLFLQRGPEPEAILRCH